MLQLWTTRLNRLKGTGEIMIDYNKLVWLPLTEQPIFEVGMAVKTRNNECFLIGDATLFADGVKPYQGGCGCCSFEIEDIVAIAYV